MAKCWLAVWAVLFSVLGLLGQSASAQAPTGSEAILFPVIVDGKWGFIDRDGKLVIPPQVDTKSQFTNGSAAVSLAGKHGYVDGHGKCTPLREYSHLYSFYGGMARV